MLSNTTNFFNLGMTGISRRLEMDKVKGGIWLGIVIAISYFRITWMKVLLVNGVIHINWETNVGQHS